MGVEQRQLLAAVDSVERVVEVEGDALRRGCEGSAGASGRFSNREIVGCEHRSRCEGVASSANLNMGSPRKALASLASS
jgi:hypothetical protein